MIPGRLDRSTRRPRGSPSAALGGAPSGAPVPTIVRVCPSRKKEAGEAPPLPASALTGLHTRGGPRTLLAEVDLSTPLWLPRPPFAAFASVELEYVKELLD